MIDQPRSDGVTDRESGTQPGDGTADEFRLPAPVAGALRSLGDRIDTLADSLPIGPARHHARQAAVATRTAADDDADLVARRVALGELVTELRLAADEADASRSQYELLELLYEEALPATRAASDVLYG
mgnify:CR=1 FL=1